MLLLKDPVRRSKRMFKQMVQRQINDLRNPFRLRVIAEGTAAAWDGRTIGDNPYLSGSNYARYWMQGFDSGIAEVKKEIGGRSGNAP